MTIFLITLLGLVLTWLISRIRQLECDVQGAERVHWSANADRAIAVKDKADMMRERDQLAAKCAEMKQIVIRLMGQKCFGPLPHEFDEEPKGFRNYVYCRDCKAELDVEDHKSGCQIGATIRDNPGQPLLDRLEKLERVRDAAIQFRKPWRSDEATENRKCDILILDEALAALEADHE